MCQIAHLSNELIYQYIDVLINEKIEDSEEEEDDEEEDEDNASRSSSVHLAKEMAAKHKKLLNTNQDELNPDEYHES